MKPLFSLAAALLAAFTLPNLAGAQSFILDTGIPGSSAAPPIISKSSFLAGEFTVAPGQTITSISAYLTAGTAVNGDTFQFDLFSSLPTRSSTQPVDSAIGTFEGNGWTTTNVSWSVTPGTTYWLALQGTQTGFQLDAPQETSNSTGTVPATAFAFSGGNGYSTSGADPIGLEVTATPEPSSWALGFVALVLALYLRRRAVQA